MADILGGLNACIGILASLKARERTGRGQMIDVSLVDCVVSAMETVIQIYLVEGRVPGRIGNRYEFIYPYDTFAAKNGWVVIGVGGEEVWKRFCKAMDREDLLEDTSFQSNRDRVLAHEQLNKIVTEWTSERGVEDIVAHLMSFSVPCAPIYSVDQVINDPHISEARQMILEMDHPLEGKMNVVACPIKFSTMKPTIRSTAPLLGEHSEEVMVNILGISKQEYSRLKESGALG